MAKVLVTGGAGFIGSHLTDALIEEGHQVVVIDNLSTGKRENLNEEAKFYEADIRSAEIEEVFKKEKPQTVFHLAAQISVRDSVKEPIKNAEINVLGTLNVAENLLRHGAGSKFVFTSTGGAMYGNAQEIPTPSSYPPGPVSPYGISKLAAEQHLRHYTQNKDLKGVSLRLANVYGPRQDSQGEAGVVAIFTAQMLNEEQPTIFGDGSQTRDYVYVKDVVNAHLATLEEPWSIGAYNIGTAQETSVNKLFEKLKQLTNFKGEAEHGPSKPGEQQRSCLNYQEAMLNLDWQPDYDLERGLKETVEWFENN